MNERNLLIDYLITQLGQVQRWSQIYNGVLGPVKRVYKIPEPARTPALAPPIQQPQEAPKEPVKVGSNG